MRVPDLQPVGRVGRAHGYQGDVHVHLDRAWLPDELPEFLFIDQDGLPVPFRLTAGTQKAADHWVVHVEAVDDDAAVRLLTGQTVRLEADRVADGIDRSDDLPAWSGFDVRSRSGDHLGRVDRVTDNEGQYLLHVQVGEDEALIPGVPPILHAVDEAARTLTVDLPEGLLDMYAS